MAFSSIHWLIAVPSIHDRSLSKESNAHHKRLTPIIFYYQISFVQACWISAALLLVLLGALPVFGQDEKSVANVGVQDVKDAKDAAKAVTTKQEKKPEDVGEKPQSGQALDDAIEANSEAQDYNEDTNPVKAQIVQEEPAVMLASGTGDLDTTGKDHQFLASELLSIHVGLSVTFSLVEQPEVHSSLCETVVEYL